MTCRDPQPFTPDLDSTAADCGLAGDELAAALLVAADGSGLAVASVELLIDHGGWLAREDFRSLVYVDAGFDDGRPMAVIDWDAVLAADLPASTSESQLLALAAELTGTDTARPLSDLICGLDDDNLRLVLRAIGCAHGRGRPVHEGGAGRVAAC